MPSVGEVASRVRVRPLAEDEAYLLGALHLQSLRAAGSTPAPEQGRPGHVQAVAQAWASRCTDLPAWVAEFEHQHLGLAIARVPALPHADGDPRLIHLSSLLTTARLQEGLEDAVPLALVRAVVAWARAAGAVQVHVADGLRLPGPVLDAVRADVVTGRTISVPTRA